ncbi:MAG: DUF3073 domain-containing protein [Actinobacteria bacterium]|nr:DUF3073 domain-containing protein [Actinomycetota bacterium]
MGRGRAKAKQTKVARALKYGGPETDLERLQRELAAAQGDVDDDQESDDVEDEDDDEESDDPYAKYYEDEDDEEDTAHTA